MTTPGPRSPSGRARNAAKRLPSSAWRTRSSCETAAPEIRGIGGSESSSKHIRPSVREEASAVRRTLRAVEDESQRDEMNAAIRAQRERGAVPRSMLPADEEPPPRPPEPPAPEPTPPKRGLLAKLFRS